MLFRFIYEGDDVKCPHCGQRYGVEWDTDYGDASVGDHSGTCLKCGKEIYFEVSIRYEQ